MIFRDNNKLFRQSLFIIYAIMFCHLNAFSQIRVSGKITDEKGEALIGVNVLVKNTNNGALSDLEGKYSLEVPDKQVVLVFFLCRVFLKRNKSGR